MEDFASAAMMRLIRAGIARQGLPAPPIPASAEARVPLGRKRQALQDLLARHGPLAILRIGEAVRHVPREPMHRALIVATDPGDLLSRWSSLERFSHSRHRVDWTAAGPGALRLEHRALAGNGAPQAAESLLVLGLLAVLVEAIGTQEVEVRPEGDGPRRTGGRWIGPADFAGFASCRITFREAAPPPAPLPPPASGPALASALRAAILADTARPWRLADLAARTGRSPRSLQRHLAALGTGPAQMVLEARLEAAAALLAGTDHGLAEIGFVCGFADQAHFNRSFRRFTAITPGSYRRAYGVAARR